MRSIRIFYLEFLVFAAGLDARRPGSSVYTCPAGTQK